jgi:hypothetical protein
MLSKPDSAGQAISKPRWTHNAGSGAGLNMSAVAGGDLAGGSLGSAPGAIVNGTDFLSLPFGLRRDPLQLRGTLSFNAE